MDVSVVMPVFNDGKYVGKELEKLCKLDVKEIVAVNDGSTDNTSGVLRNASKKYSQVRFLEHKQNQGKGAAMVTGAKATTGDTVVFVDADGQFDVREIPKLIGEMKRLEADMIVGARDFRHIPFPRRITNTLTKFAIFLGTGKMLDDPTCGFRALRRKDFTSLNITKNHYEIESEINYRMLKKNMRIAFTPISVRYLGNSRITFRHGVQIAIFLTRVIFRVA